MPYLRIVLCLVPLSSPLVVSLLLLRLPLLLLVLLPPIKRINCSKQTIDDPDQPTTHIQSTDSLPSDKEIIENSFFSAPAILGKYKFYFNADVHCTTNRPEVHFSPIIDFRSCYFRDTIHTEGFHIERKLFGRNIVWRKYKQEYIPSTVRIALCPICITIKLLTYDACWCPHTLWGWLA